MSAILPPLFLSVCAPTFSLTSPSLFLQRTVQVVPEVHLFILCFILPQSLSFSPSFLRICFFLRLHDHAQWNNFPLASNNGLPCFPDWGCCCCSSAAETVARWDVADLLIHSRQPSFLVLVLFTFSFHPNYKNRNSAVWEAMASKISCFPTTWDGSSWHCTEAAGCLDGPYGAIFQHFFIFLILLLLLQLPLFAVMVTDEAN